MESTRVGVIVVDTSVLIDHLRRRTSATEALEEANAAGHDLSASVVTKIELLWNMRAPENRSVRALIDALDWLPVSDPVAERAGELARRHRASHSGIDMADYIIAATVIDVGAELWTTNLRHYPMFADLAAPY